MNRLQIELHRLYDPDADDPARLVDAGGRVRALVLEVARSASWEVLGTVWHGVQADLELPAPGIAVSGTDGLQLWFSLDVPVPATAAHAFLEALRSHFLPDVPLRRLRLWPLPTASSHAVDSHARRVPARDGATGNWSAFVAADLAPVFADTPWLDIPPGEDGQAGLLRGLARMKPSAFDAACERLGRFAQPAPASPAGPPRADAALPRSEAVATAAPPPYEPRRFLLRVMNDDTVALALRIEAAKALLSCPESPTPGDGD